ncbi:hypothetical protein [Hymenobacter canadensis]|uniref:DUF4136 domain-containing protein n=1 Tax=Hymenobacter canadensis TaxID=2999067 RepID=A0ABY7LWS3_9BACT|nr:hypothetical protein [Hymenobacter canadensis]WBA44367.1 hypothetical protein O3303_21410 [Hymenobacter canadensis]
MMLRWTLVTTWTFCCWILSINASAQQGKDHLVPTEGIFTSYSHEQAYYSRVGDVLLAGLTDSPLARVVVLPSFSPEYVLSLEQRAAKYYLTYRICQTRVWSNYEKTPAIRIQVNTTTVELSKPAALLVAKAFKQAIAKTRYPAPSKYHDNGSDGTSYHFSHFQLGIGLRGGQTWSPEKGSKMSDLVALTTTLNKVAAAPTDAKIQITLTKQAQLLIVRLTKE